MMTRCVYVLCSIGLLAVGGCAQNRYRHPSADLYLEKANEALEQKNCWEAQKLLRESAVGLSRVSSGRPGPSIYWASRICATRTT